MKERDLEDYICTHPEAVFWEGAQIIGRQIYLPHGVLDVLAYGDERIWVAELKAGRIRACDVGQVMRYAHDIQSKIAHDIMNIMVDYNPPIGIVKRLEEYLSPFQLGGTAARICPVLIGYNITEPALAAALGAHCMVFLYRRKDNGLEFQTVIQTTQTETGCPEWALTLKQIVIQDCIKHETETLRRLRKRTTILDKLLNDQGVDK